MSKSSMNFIIFICVAFNLNLIEKSEGRYLNAWTKYSLSSSRVGGENKNRRINQRKDNSDEDTWQLISSSSDTDSYFKRLISRTSTEKSISTVETHSLQRISESESDITSPSSSSSPASPINQSSSSENIKMRLTKLDYYFNQMKVFDENCKQRFLCETARNPSRYFPLSSSLLDETNFTGDEKTLSSHLLISTEGARLLRYIEAAQIGTKKQNKENCEWTFQYSCPIKLEDMINFESLKLWKEMSKWLVVRIVAK